MVPDARCPSAETRKASRSSVQASSSSDNSQANSVLARPIPSLMRRRASSFPSRWGITTISGSDIAAVSPHAHRHVVTMAAREKGLRVRAFGREAPKTCYASQHHDEARELCGRQYLRASQAAGHDRSKARRGDRAKHAQRWPEDANPGAAGRGTLRACRGPAPAGGCQVIGRADHRRLPRSRAEALMFCPPGSSGMLLVFRCTHALTGRVLLAHIRTGFGLAVLFVAGEVIDL